MSDDRTIERGRVDRRHSRPRPAGEPRRRSVNRRAPAQPERDERSRATELSTRTGRKPLVTLLALLACLAALAAGLGGVLTVRNVDVIGPHLPSGTIVQAAGVTGQNIFAVRADQVIDRLSTVPSIEVTRVETSFPDTVRVYASARQPVVVWRSANGLYLVDRTGFPFARVATTNLPIVSGGTRPPDADTIVAIRYATRLLAAAPNGALSSFAVNPGAGLTITGHSGWKALLGQGSAQIMVTRVATLADLLRVLAGKAQHFSLLDLRGSQPYIR